MSLGYADLPRQTTADYLTGCTDPNERKLAEGRTIDDVPSTPEAFELAFKQSKIDSRMIIERDAFVAAGQEDERRRQDFREAVLTDKRLAARKSSPFTASFGAQVWALTN
jgi:ATP-binding cassette subfamily G (WHITE) protein 2 (SNQ2)